MPFYLKKYKVPNGLQNFWLQNYADIKGYLNLSWEGEGT
jgi:hypothetical protein